MESKRFGRTRRKSSITYDGDLPAMLSGDTGRMPAVARIVEQLKSIEVQFGETASFECKIKGNPFPTLTWFKNGLEILLPSERIWTETCNDGKHTLVLRDVCESDIGSYRCTALNKLGRDSTVALLKSPSRYDELRCSVSNNYDVVDLANDRIERSPEFITLPQATIANKGETISFECQTFNHPPSTIEWYKDSNIINSTDRVNIITLSEKCVLVISEFSLDDKGLYQCIASNKLGKTSYSFKVELAGDNSIATMSNDQPPSFIQTLQPFEVCAGERVRFECKVDGRPKPSVMWNKNGRILRPSTRVRINEICGNHSLVLPRVDPSDSGIYSLVATNRLGSEKSSSELRVQDTGGMNNSPYGYRIGSGQTSPNDSNVSSPAVSPKLGKAQASRLVTGNASPFAANLRFSNRGGAGAGAPQRKRAPGFILRPRPQTIAIGDKLCLKCTLLGHPKPTVTWEKNGELVDEEKTNGHIRTRIEEKDFFLEIDEVNLGDGGKYTVTARNSLGKQMASVDVTVTDADGSVSEVASKTRSSNKFSPSTNGTASNQNDTFGPRTNISESDHKISKTTEHHAISNLKQDQDKESPNSSISSTAFSHSRLSTSFNNSRHDVDDQGNQPANLRMGRRKQNMVAPTFIRRLSSTQVLEGDELLLQCEVSGDPGPRMAWKRNGVEVGIDEDEVFTSFRDGVARLRLRDVQPYHAGEYVCIAKNDVGSIQCSSRVTVKAKRVEIRPRFTKSPSDVRAVEGETVILEAEVSGDPAPEVVWSLDGEEIVNGDVSFQNGIARLTLHNITLASSGQYMCNALNSSGEDSVACRVRVKEKKSDILPQFTAPLSDLTVNEGDDVSLRCMVTGIPEPSVQWSCDGEIFEPDEGITITYQDGVASLTLSHATPDDAGQYSCVATNSEGQVSSRSVVVVKPSTKSEKKAAPSSPPKFLATFDEYIRTQEGETLDLQCTISGNPSPEVTCLINDKKVENCQVTSENGQVRILISPITSSHGGHIKCMLTNAAGKACHEARIYVRSKRVAPTFEVLLPETIDIHEGEEAYFECKVSGHPQPRVSWTRDGRTLSVLSTETTYENGVAAVRIRKSGPREAGKYVCVARNLSGESQSVCVVRYIETSKKKAESQEKVPKFTSTLSDVTLQDGQDLHLKCKVEGNPTPEITWHLDDQKIGSDEGDIKLENGVASLILEDTMPEDSGIYTCTAVNKVGKATCSCRVTVQEAKKIDPVKPAASIKKEPSFPLVLDDITIKEGEDILLKCQVVGNPRPKITWILDGEEIQDAEIKYTEEGDIELLLRDAVPEDEGVYSCIAENPLKRVMTACKVSIDALPRAKKSGAGKKQEIHKAKINNSTTPKAETKPSFTQPLKDAIVQDGSTNFALTCFVAGNPSVRWFHNDVEIEENEDFQLIKDGDARKLVFAEIYPDDAGTYTCVISNQYGETKCSCTLDIQEIEGDTPTFLLKPKPSTVKIGTVASFSCRVDGDPAPTVQWMFGNRAITELDRVRVIEASAENNYTHTLEIQQVCAQDAGRYSVCCRNLLGDITCTVSLIVDDVNHQESRTDFRDVLKKSPTKTPASKTSSNEENVDFRAVLRKPSDKEPLNRTPSSGVDESEEVRNAYKEALSNPVTTKALTEEERKLKKAEQQDFRANLVRKVDTKVVTQDALRVKETGQVDFRDEALRTKVQTKAIGQDELKSMRAEQVDFRSETIKTKVQTKAYKEEIIKAKKAEQVDFRDVLSPTAKREDDPAAKDENGMKISDIPRSKWKKEVDHTTVATKRSRKPIVVVSGKNTPQHIQKDEQEEPSWTEPEFLEELKDISIKEGDPFELTCHVTGHPAPTVKWFLEQEDIESEWDMITISYADGVCRLSIAESLPEDQGKYTCVASNEHGERTSSCYVTVHGDETSSSPISSVSTKIPPKILSGPKDCVTGSGKPILLKCLFQGTPPVKVVWRKGKKEIEASKFCKINLFSDSSELRISSCQRDDSGCYTIQLSNSAGVDQFSSNVHVIDSPDPPGKPFTEVRSGKGIIVSWYGCSYDGGSSVTEYRLEMLKLTSSPSKSRIRWSEVTSSNITSYTVENVENGVEYQFRISAKNECGWSEPGPPSDKVRYHVAVENGVESSDDEDENEFVEYDPVEIKKTIKFSSMYEIREKLGQGRFGKVHRVVHRQTGKQYAAKIMRALKAKDREAVTLEIDIMNLLRHPKLVQLIEAYQHDREVTMVMDLVSGGELFERVIDEDFELTEAACIKYMRQICHGVKFMHDSSIVHLDLKPENIMCVDKMGTRVKLIDFGLARKFNPNDSVRVMFGTPEFVAPEVINYDVIGFKTDMWSVGVICYILLSGLSPFAGDGDTETLSNVTAAIWDFDDEAFDQISEDAKDFISHLLIKNLRRRFDVDQALNHKWLKKNTTKMKKSKLDTKNLRRFLARRKWQKTGNAVRALGRLASLAKLTPIAKRPGEQRESGFLVALRAQLEREKESDQTLPEKQKPEFIETFSDAEVMEGSMAMLSCVIFGKPDPGMTWYRNGQLIRSSRRFRISSTEEGGSLTIRNVCLEDEGEYKCQLVNSEGEVSHTSKLSVVKL